MSGALEEIARYKVLPAGCIPTTSNAKLFSSVSLPS
jgi:hypothetical protein